MKYPDIKVQLVGQDGNAFAIMGRVTSALKSGLRGKLSPEEISAEVKAFQNECMSGDYDNLLVTCLEWVDCDPWVDEDDNDFDIDDDDYYTFEDDYVDEDEEDWVDPAGGTHSAFEEDPARMYE